MRVKIQKWGNSLAMRLPKKLAEDLGMSEGSEVDITVRQGRLEISTKDQVPPLDVLLQEVREENLHGDYWSDMRPVAARPNLSHEEKLAKLKATSARLLESFQDPVNGDRNLRQALLESEMIHEDGSVVPFFAGMFSEKTLARVRPQ